MTTEEIIAEIWKMPLGDVLRVAFVDDWILFVKAWPVWVALAVIGILWAIYDYANS